MKMNAPTVAIKLAGPHPVEAAYVTMRLGILSRKNIGKKMRLNPTKESMKWIFPRVSLYILPVILGSQ